MARTALHRQSLLSHTAVKPLVCLPLLCTHADEAVSAAFLTPAALATSSDYIWAVAVGGLKGSAAEGTGKQQQRRRRQQQQGPAGADGAEVAGLCKDRSIWRCARQCVWLQPTLPHIV